MPNSSRPASASAGKQRRDFLKRLGQIAVVVEGVDQQLDEYRSRSPRLVSESWPRK